MIRLFTAVQPTTAYKYVLYFWVQTLYPDTYLSNNVAGIWLKDSDSWKTVTVQASEWATFK